VLLRLLFHTEAGVEPMERYLFLLRLFLVAYHNFSFRIIEDVANFLLVRRGLHLVDKFHSLRPLLAGLLAELSEVYRREGALGTRAAESLWQAPVKLHLKRRLQSVRSSCFYLIRLANQSFDSCR
jgi:hypothetical protein